MHMLIKRKDIKEVKKICISVKNYSALLKKPASNKRIKKKVLLLFYGNWTLKL